jgi:N-acetyl sugar amidotransferase
MCPACLFVLNKEEIGWNDRLERIKSVTEKFRNKGKGYDAILGVSGGKDSVKLALWARDHLKMRILLVTVSYPPEQVTKRGTHNLSNLAELGFDVFSLQPSPVIWRQLMRSGFLQFGNWAKSTEMALFAGVPQVAITQKIPLILWGENPGLQLGDLATLGSEGWDGNNLRNMNTLSGGIDALAKESGLSKENLQPYIYPSSDLFVQNGIQIIYLGWAMNQWGLLENGLFSSLVNLQSRTDSPINTQDLLKVTSLDEDWVTLNQMIKFYKYGFGRATDYVNEWIRSRRITRTQGIPIVEKFDGNCDESYIDSFCAYLEISTEIFWETVYKFTNTDLFRIEKGKRPAALFRVGEGLS